LLVGMMGAGKTTVGRLLATRLGWRYLDSDDEVVAMTGRTVKELFDAGGEAAFRPLESDALVAAVSGAEPAVVSVAGGAVLDPANREILRRAGFVVWLRATPATLAGRVQAAEEHPHRPLLGDDPSSAVARLDAARRPLYEELADAVVDVDAHGPDEVADRVLEGIPWRH
ncbi:MAG: shikimate kinase, partial [Acidimicrobiales bacterium]